MADSGLLCRHLVFSAGIRQYQPVAGWIRQLSVVLFLRISLSVPFCKTFFVWYVRLAAWGNACIFPAGAGGWRLHRGCLCGHDCRDRLPDAAAVVPGEKAPGQVAVLRVGAGCGRTGHHLSGAGTVAEEGTGEGNFRIALQHSPLFGEMLGYSGADLPAGRTAHHCLDDQGGPQAHPSCPVPVCRCHGGKLYDGFCHQLP